MNKTAIIRELISWIESHLQSPLSLDLVAKKSGYSKWHFQRMFKSVTGKSPGAYIRSRRLSRCAIELRLTAYSVMDIAMRYQFDSQQTFTRAFKKQFLISPGKYRQSAVWKMSGLTPPLRKDNNITPSGTFITLPDIYLTGITHSYGCSIDEASEKREEMCFNYWQRFLQNFSILPKLIYGLHEPIQAGNKSGYHQVYYTTAISRQMDNEYVTEILAPLIKGGDYIKFCYKGPKDGLKSFFMLIYDTCLPSLNIIRRQGQDIECFHLNTLGKKILNPELIHCEYLIPVER